MNVDMINAQLKEARENLQSIRADFENDPELLSVYEPAAMFLVEELESELISSI